MSDLSNKAQRLLLEIEAIREGNFENRTSDLLALVNEALKDATQLAQQVIEEQDTKKAA